MDPSEVLPLLRNAVKTCRICIKRIGPRSSHLLTTAILAMALVSLSAEPREHGPRNIRHMTIIGIALALIVTHLAAWTITFLTFVGFAPELAFAYFTDAWTFSAGELPSLVWLYSWSLFLILLRLYLGARWLVARRARTVLRM